MKSLIISIILMLSFFISKKEFAIGNLNSSTSETIFLQELSIQEKIAQAYGIEHWSKVNQIDFSFVVNPGTEKEYVRRWSWKPKSRKVTRYANGDTLTYNRNEIKESEINADKAFVNDSFWLLFPFHLVWDDVEILTYENQTSPLSKQPTTKLRVNYPNKGGYTPGDSYEVYVDGNFKIVEWTYHRGGTAEPSLANTFENQQSFNGIKIDMEHANPEIGFQLNFRDVLVK